MNLTLRILLGLLLTGLVVGLLLTWLDNAHLKAAAIAVTLVCMGTLAAIATYRRLNP